MLYSLVFDMPVKTGLKFMAPIGSNRADPERILLYHVVHKLNRTFLQAVEKVVLKY